MTEGQIWAAIIGAVEALCIAFLSYVIYKLDRVVEKFTRYVTNESCNVQMCEHQKSISQLQQDVKKHTEDIGFLKGQMKGR